MEARAERPQKSIGTLKEICYTYFEIFLDRAQKRLIFFRIDGCLEHDTCQTSFCTPLNELANCVLSGSKANNKLKKKNICWRDFKTVAR